MVAVESKLVCLFAQNCNTSRVYAAMGESKMSVAHSLVDVDPGSGGAKLHVLHEARYHVIVRVFYIRCRLVKKAAATAFIEVRNHLI